jgi:aryl-alcohol dehydrogenase-like predicted oxidoreductase
MRQIGPFKVNPIGLGCMGMSHGYGKSDLLIAKQTLHKALDIGYNFLDTAALYGFGANEKLIGDTLASRRNEFILASKCGLIRGPDGKRLLDAHPDSIRRTCDNSLQNLQTEIIDLYYLHRVDPKIPLDDQIGTLADLIQEGKIRSIGLSEVSAKTIRKAHAIHPISAVQSEYSLWTRNPESSVIDCCAELKIAFVAFSPVGRGFLTDQLRDPSQLAEGDLRLTMPRFYPENFFHNLQLLEPLKKIAHKLGATTAQVSLAWLLAKAAHIIPIPGTTHPQHCEENLLAQKIKLDANDILQLDNSFNESELKGKRYNDETLACMET